MKDKLIGAGEDIPEDGDDFFFWYIYSAYFVTTTVTTVGYGDISPTNTVERIFVFFLMFTGVCAFTFASGALSSILSNQDHANAKLQEKLMLLNNIKKQFTLSDDLYNQLSLAIKYEFSKDL